jgi:hypothetical protein
MQKKTARVSESFIRSLSLTVPILVFTVSQAVAGGGFSGFAVSSQSAPGSSQSNSSASADVKASGEYGSYESTITANAGTTGTPSGGLQATVSTGSNTTAKSGSYVQDGVQIDTISKATAYTKGANAIDKSRTETLVTVVINGRTYVVAEEVAMAMARVTALGSSSAASVSVNGSGGNGYSSTSVDTHVTPRGQ